MVNKKIIISLTIIGLLCILLFIGYARWGTGSAINHPSISLVGEVGNHADSPGRTASDQSTESVNFDQLLEETSSDLEVLKWVETSSWNHTPTRRDFGLRVARPPQYLWLDWIDVQEAESYRVYFSYSEKPYDGRVVTRYLLASTKISEYHSGDTAYLSGKPRQFTQNGYYRFWAEAESADRVRKSISDSYELELSQNAPKVAPGPSYNQMQVEKLKRRSMPSPQ